MKLLCVFLGHHRNRRRVYREGLFWRTTCVRCGEKLAKSGSDGKWRRATRAEAHDGRWP